MTAQASTSPTPVRNQAVAETPDKSPANMTNESVNSLEGATTADDVEVLIATKIADLETRLQDSNEELSAAGQVVDETYEDFQHDIDMIHGQGFENDPRSPTLLKAKRTEIKSRICEYDTALFNRGVVVEEFAAWVDDAMDEATAMGFSEELFKRAVIAKKVSTDTYESRYADRKDKYHWNGFITIE